MSGARADHRPAVLRRARVPSAGRRDGAAGPWSNRPGSDEIGSTVAGLFALEGTLSRPKQPPIVPICDNVVGWLGTVGCLPRCVAGRSRAEATGYDGSADGKAHGVPSPPTLSSMTSRSDPKISQSRTVRDSSRPSRGGSHELG